MRWVARLTVVLAATGLFGFTVRRTVVSTDNESRGAAVLAVQADDPTDPALVGLFDLRFYHLAIEDRGEPTVTVYDRQCEPLARVTPRFAAVAALQGTGRLRNGRLINYAGRCNCDYSPCFQRAPGPWGRAASGANMVPLRTVAVDPSLIPSGTWLYVPAFDGLPMPGDVPWGGFVHDGCVVAEDTGGNIRGTELDWFVATATHQRDLRHLLTAPVAVMSGAHCATTDFNLAAKISAR